MKRILSGIIAIFVLLVFVGVAFADNSQRKLSTSVLTTSQSIKDVPGTIYGVDIVATAAQGFATVFDYAGSDMGDLPSEKSLVEVKEATQYDSKHRDLGKDGIKAYKGIYLYLSNATAIVYYY